MIRTIKTYSKGAPFYNALIRTLCELSKSSANEGALLLRSALGFGPFTLPGRGPRFAIDRNFGLCRRTHKIWCEYHGFLELILFSGKRQRSCTRNRVPTDGDSE